MAKAHKGINTLTDYLRYRFPFGEIYICEVNGQEREYSYEEVKRAMNLLKKTDPKLAKLLQYRYLTAQSRIFIADSLYMDSSTLKRHWDRAMFILQNWLVHGLTSEEGESEPLFVPLDDLDPSEN